MLAASTPKTKQENCVKALLTPPSDKRILSFLVHLFLFSYFHCFRGCAQLHQGYIVTEKRGPQNTNSYLSKVSFRCTVSNYFLCLSRSKTLNHSLTVPHSLPFSPLTSTHGTLESQTQLPSLRPSLFFRMCELSQPLQRNTDQLGPLHWMFQVSLSLVFFVFIIVESEFYFIPFLML